MVAAADLRQALDTQLASAGVQGATRIGLTFRNKDGRGVPQLCRARRLRGLACREGDDWKIEGLFRRRGVLRAIIGWRRGTIPLGGADRRDDIAGEPLDADGERAALAKGWR